EQKKNQLSRFDCIASLLMSSECTVIQDIFQTLSQFPIAFPLVTPDFNEEAKFKIMLPLFTGPVIKWETKPGTIIENHLFKSLFRMIVATRIGTNTPGKSSILNLLMSSDSMFSSSGEPGAEYGTPHMIDGSIEFTWLVQETCGMGLWKDIFENFYKEKDEIVLLANLHGDALDYPDQIHFLKQFPTSFLIFLMPGYDEKQKKVLENLIDHKKIVYCLVDSGNKTRNSIDTKSLTRDKTLKKLTEEIEFPESQHLIDFIKKKTCLYIKLEVMQLQRNQYNDGYKIFQANHELQHLLVLYINVLTLPLDKRRRALAHIEKEVSRISSIESSDARKKAMIKKDELRKSSLVDRVHENKNKARSEMAEIWKEIDNMSLGLEHFFRELGQIYKIISVQDKRVEIMKLPEFYAELLISGHTIELLDGDTGTIAEAFFSAICKHVSRLCPNLRIFVVSILGLQSSGKSTLLNALFACRFAVSVGRCTRGLFMRLLFLEKDLSDHLGVDAFVLIDTEGLGAPEKMNEPESEKKDRMLATFAMGISNLTILNVLGESTRDLTEILQIAIVTMARLEEAGMAPDIRMVQHVSERNTSKFSEPEEKFREALREALTIADEKDTAVGISSMKCLQILDERIKKGQLLKQFRPFKNGATAHAPPSRQYHEDVVDLYNSILDDCKNSLEKIEFTKWGSLIQCYWRAVSHEDFAVRFRNIKEIYDFINLGERIARVKETINEAFFQHEEQITQKFRTELLKWSHDHKTNSDLKNKCSEFIKEGLIGVPGCNKNCYECKKANKERDNLGKYLKDNKKDEKCKIEIRRTFDDYIQRHYDSSSIKLIRILEANFIRKGLSSEFLEIINKDMEQIMNEMKGNAMSDGVRKQKVEDIWMELREYISSTYKVRPVTEQIDEEVKDVFNNMESLFNKYKEGTLPNLSKCKAYKTFFGIRSFGVDRCPDQKDADKLEKELDDLTDVVLEKKNSHHFYSGIVRELKKEINTILEKFSTLWNKRLIPEFKWNVYLYALLMFTIKMKSYQEKWDKENNPLFILDQKKEVYRNLINTRLQYGFTLVSEGHIIGDYLLEVIHKKAIKAGNLERIKTVKDVTWMTSSETVRLKYFEMLAEQVQNGNKEEAIIHFLHPRRWIESWFKCEVNNIRSNADIEYNKTYNSEFDHVIQQIRNCQNLEEIKNYVSNYMSEVEEVDYEINLEKDNTFEKQHIKLSSYIEKRLNNCKNPMPGGFRNPSDDESVMDMLGCTKTCYWCGALCWGSRGHVQNAGETKKHHTSHQPGGLNNTRYKNSNELVAIPCQKRSDERGVLYYGKEVPTKWGDAKIKDFSEWKFEYHHNDQFNDLMCWFFENLNHDLAKKWNLLPASSNELKKYGCTNLDYYSIISTLEQRIN
ncbi:18787_t:CDS:2, partial [Racocetra persica]